MWLTGWGEALRLYDKFAHYDVLVHFLVPLLGAPIVYIALSRLDVLPEPREHEERHHYVGLFLVTLTFALGESIHRSVMIGVNPPGHFLWYPQTTDEQIGRYADLCSKDESCSKRTDDLAATLPRTSVPDDWFFLPIKEGNVRLASFFGLAETTSEYAPLSAPMTLSSWLSAEDSDASGFWFQSLLADFAFPRGFGRVGRLRLCRES